MKVMKQSIYVLVCIVSSLLISCGSSDNFGYPSKITFDKKGRETLISGNNGIYHIDIVNYDGEGVSAVIGSEVDTIVVTNDWLSVRWKLFDSKLIVTAQPNATGKKRKLYIRGMVDNFFADIKVVQH